MASKDTPQDHKAVTNAQVPEEAVEKMAAEQGPRWPSRRSAWLDGFRHGEMQARMTGGPTVPVSALLSDEVEARVEAVLLNHGMEPEDAAQAAFRAVEAISEQVGGGQG